MKMRHSTPKLLAVSIGLALSVNSLPVSAEDYFDPAFLTMSGIKVEDLDLSAFAKADSVPPGTYLVTVNVNQTNVGQYTLEFAGDSDGKVTPRLTPDFLHSVGVNTQGLATFRDLPANEPVPSLGELIEHARANFDFPKLQLDLSIPQVAMQPGSRGMTSPENWDDGVPAMLFNYSLNGNRSWQQQGGENTNLYGNVDGGVNLGAWRLRSSMNWFRNTYSHPVYANWSSQKTSFSNTYLMRDIRALRSELLVGESSTDNDVFDSVPFTGALLRSTDEMLPYVMRGFAPVIEGIAQSNARITVFQNGSVIYQTYVAPGPYRLEDLGQTSSGGDITVQTTEADGRVHSQVIPVSTVPVMRRAGSLKYAVTAGRYNGSLTVGNRAADFVQGTAIYGLPGNITLYGGALVASDYSAAVAGTGVSLGGMGALSADVTSSRAVLPGQPATQKGNSYRIRYAKSMLTTGTTLDLAAYRYSTHNYYSFADFNNSGYAFNDESAPWTRSRQRSAFQLRMSQQLGSFGSAYVSASRSDYWRSNKVLNSVSAGYSGNVNRIGYTLSYSIDRSRGDGSWPENRELSLNLSLPLSLFSSSGIAENAYASYQASRDRDGRVQQLASINGNAMDSQLSYGASQSWSNGQESRTSALNLSYDGSKGNVFTGYTQSAASRSLNLGGRGAVVVHPEGVTFGKTLGNSIAIISAPESEGTQVGASSVATDSRGYAIQPYLTNYQSNTISLNPTTMPDNVDVAHSSVNVHPTKGAVVMAKFVTKVGYQVLIALQHQGKPVPFGATAVVENADDAAPNTGIVGDDGQLYMSGLPAQGKVRVTWGKQANQQCTANWDLRNSQTPDSNNPVRSLNARCQ